MTQLFSVYSHMKKSSPIQCNLESFQKPHSFLSLGLLQAVKSVMGKSVIVCTISPPGFLFLLSLWSLWFSWIELETWSWEREEQSRTERTALRKNISNPALMFSEYCTYLKLTLFELGPPMGSTETYTKNLQLPAWHRWCSFLLDAQDISGSSCCPLSTSHFRSSHTSRVGLYKNDAWYSPLTGQAFLLSELGSGAIVSTTHFSQTLSEDVSSVCQTTVPVNFS